MLMGSLPVLVFLRYLLEIAFYWVTLFYNFFSLLFSNSICYYLRKFILINVVLLVTVPDKTWIIN